MNETEPRIAPLEPADPRTLGSYQVLGRLGAGGMGVVYLGAGQNGTQVAIKVIRRDFAVDPAFRARFATEVANACRVASFCTAQVLEHGESQGMPYLVTEFVQGMPLKDYVETYGPFPAASLRALTIGIGTALLAIHAARLVHRDLKPHNVLLAKDGPRVIDFGIARAMDATSQHTATGVVVGSPGWIAPEQFFDGIVSPAGDVFCWGSLVAFAATGRHPYGPGNMMVLAVRAQQGLYDLTGVPDDLRGLVERTLNPDPALRPTGEQLVLELIGQGGEQEAQTQISSVWSPSLLPPQVFAPLQVPAPRPPGQPSFPPTTQPPFSQPYGGYGQGAQIPHGQGTQPPYSQGGTQPPYGQGGTQPPYGPSTSAPRPAKSRVPLIAGAVALVVALCGGGAAAYTMMNGGGKPDPIVPTEAAQSGVPTYAVDAVNTARSTVEKVYDYAGYDSSSFLEPGLPVTAKFQQRWTQIWTKDRQKQAKQQREVREIKLSATGVISSSRTRIDALMIGDGTLKSSTLDQLPLIQIRVTLLPVNGTWSVDEISEVKENQQTAINQGAQWPGTAFQKASADASTCLSTFLTIDGGSVPGHKVGAGACLLDDALAKDLPDYENRMVKTAQSNTVTLVDVAAETYPLVDKSKMTLLVSTVLSQDLADNGDTLVAPYTWRLTMKQSGTDWKISDLENLEPLKSS